MKSDDLFHRVMGGTVAAHRDPGATLLESRCAQRLARKREWNGIPPQLFVLFAFFVVF